MTTLYNCSIPDNIYGLLVDFGFELCLFQRLKAASQPKATAFDMASVQVRSLDVEVCLHAAAAAKTPHNGDGTYYEDYDVVFKNGDDNQASLFSANSCAAEREITVAPPHQPRIVVTVDSQLLD